MVFGGESAGGWGAINYLDEFAEQLQKYNIKVLGLFDSPLLFDVDPMFPTHGNSHSKDMSIAFKSYN